MTAATSTFLSASRRAIGDVVRGGDEAAEDDGGAPLVDQLLDTLGEHRELAVLGAGEGVGLARIAEQALAVHVATLVGLLAAGGDVDAFAGLVVELVEHGAPAQLVGLLGGVGLGGGRAVAQSAGRGGGAAGKRAQKAEHGPPAHALPVATVARLEGFAGVGEHLVEQRLVLGRERVGEVVVVAFREGRVGVQVALDVAALALHEVLRQVPPEPLVARPGEVLGQVTEGGLEEAQAASGTRPHYRYGAWR